MTRTEIANHTLKILETGMVNKHSIKADLEKAVKHTELFIGTEPEMGKTHPREFQTKIIITNETSLQALERMTREHTDEVLCLNFASAKNPGGGFLGGAQAQEESLARSSGLYSTLLAQPNFYAFHRQQHDLLYSHRMIYSPHVPVFKNDTGDTCEPYNTTFITCAAPNAGAISTNQAHSTHLIPVVLEERAKLVLGLAAIKNHSRLVLGAWGCGVFRNNPQMVATVFKKLLEGRFKNVFAEIVFAVYDKSKGTPVYAAFEEVFKS